MPGTVHVMADPGRVVGGDLQQGRTAGTPGRTLKKPLTVMQSPPNLRTFLIGLLVAALAAPLAAADEPRYAVVSDMTHDDGNSLIRLLYYANEIDLEAIIVAPQEPDYPWNADGPWNKCQSILDGYAQVYEQLQRHDPAYPTPDTLRRITQRGHGALRRRAPGATASFLAMATASPGPASSPPPASRTANSSAGRRMPAPVTSPGSNTLSNRPAK